MAVTESVFLSLGANVGDRKGQLARALELLSARGVGIVKRSSLYETAPQDVTDQPWFLNMVAEVQTGLDPEELLRSMQSVERELGRNRAEAVRFGPRSIDLDVLLFGERQIASAELTVPHPRMKARRFVLEPLLEIAPDLHDPVSGAPLRDFLTAVLDQEIRLVL